MIYKVLCQKDQIVSPRGETTKALFLETDNIAAARAMVGDSTSHNIKLIQELTRNSLAYKRQNPDFKLTAFRSKNR